MGTCASVSLTNAVTGTLQAAQFPALTGDITTPGASLATTLASTGVGAGSVGSATAIPTLTVDAKGRLTAKGTATPQLTLTSTYFSSLSGANLTGILTSALSGALPAGNFPAMTGDVTNSAGSLATTVGKIGGNAVALGGAFTMSGASTFTGTLTGNTSVTFPISGTLLSSTVTTLSSLVSIGTITTGVWNATPVVPTYGGTGLATATAHGSIVGEGTSTFAVIGGCTNGVLSWSVSSSDPTCANAPITANPGFTGSWTLGGTGIAGAAGTDTALTKIVTGISDAASTPVLTVTVPNAANAATVHVVLLGSIGAGGAVGALECSATLEGNITVTRTSGLATVATASTAAVTSNSCVSGATTITFAYAVSGNTGANSATQTFTVNATITKGGGSSTNHQVVVEAETINSQVSGVITS